MMLVKYLGPGQRFRYKGELYLRNEAFEVTNEDGKELVKSGQCEKVSESEAATQVEEDGETE